MKAFAVRHKKLHLWFLSCLALLAVFFAVRGQRAWMNALSDYVVRPLCRALGGLCYRVDISVAEVLCGLLALFTAGYLAWSVVGVLRTKKGQRGGRTYSAALGAVCAGLTIYGSCCFLWGIQYYTDSFQDKSGLRAEEVTQESLTAVTQYFADRLSETALSVPRDENGLFAVSREEIFDASTTVYDAVSRQYPFLTFDDQVPKAVHFSRVMSQLAFTGFYCPFTGESNLNVDSPPCLLPSTIAHELAHQRGIASEQECTFLSVLASVTCGDADYAYSGWLLGYIYLGNALHAADQARWQTVYDTLPEVVRADLHDNNAYWAQFRDSAVKKVSNRVYDGFLKSYGDEQGIQSYGTVVDLLVAYYARPQ